MSRVPSMLAAIAVGLTLVGCSTLGETPDEPSASDAAAGHGEVEGAEEMAEPQLHLVLADAEGSVGMLDLLTEQWQELPDIAPAIASASDGRYLLSLADDGVTIVDSGMWTWDHGDHFHYYRSEPSVVGTVPGAGVAVVATGLSSTTGGTGLVFPDSDEAVLLDNEALADGEIVERFRIPVTSDGAMLAPIGDGAVLADADEVRVLGAEGSPTGTMIACEAPAGQISTRVGVVIGCADGAVLATGDGDVALESIAYPAGTAADARALTFDAREGRPTVAGLTSDGGLWLLDTRERTWTLVPSETPFVSAVAADDDDEHIVALDEEGRVVVLSPDGTTLASTDALLPETIASDTGLAAASLVVDDQRAYLGAPLEGVVHEIDYADGARIARTFETTLAPVLMAEVGR